MATAYKNLAQAQAAYDTIRQQKERLQRNDYIREQQAVMGVNNYLKQNGYNGGAAESILLRARGNRSDFGSYDAQLADLAAIISGFRTRGRGGYGAGTGAAASINAGAQRSIGALSTAALLSEGGTGGYGYNQNRRYNVGSYR
ncbi:MAG: hypothetical protein E7554_01890 [Ruminococcaceae bacterium]|nr:hypothetical protein [Oscillospiraceae bacterium]